LQTGTTKFADYQSVLTESDLKKYSINTSD